MAAVWWRVWSELRSRWAAWGAVALLIGVAGGAVLTTAAGARRTDTAFSRYLNAARAADELVSPNERGLGGFYAAMRRIPEVAVLAPVVGVAVIRREHPRGEIQLSLPTTHEYGHAIERPKVTAGRMPNPGHADEVFADAATVRVYGVHPGSRLGLRVLTSLGPADLAHARALTVRVVGVGITRSDILPVNHLATQPTIVGTPALWHQLGPQYEGFDGAYVRLRPGASRADFERRGNALTQKFPQTGGGLFIANQADQARQVDQAIHPQATALAIFSLLAALTGLVVIGQVLARQVYLGSAEHPTLRALGMSRRELTIVGLAEAAAAATVGALLAVVLAIAASPLMPIGPARSAEPDPGIEVDRFVLGLGFLLIVVLLVARVVWTAWHAASVGALANESDGSQRPSRVSEAAVTLGIPASGAIGMRFALEPGRGRTAVPVRSALAGTIVAIAAVAGAVTFGTSLTHLVDTPRLYGQTWDATLDVQFGTLSQSRTDRFLRAEPGMRAWTYGTHDEVTIAGHRVPAVELAAGRGRLLAPTLLEGRSAAAPNEIVLGTKMLDAAHRHVGQTVRVRSLAGAGGDMRIVGRGVFPYFGEGGFTPTGLGNGAALGTASIHKPNFVLVRIAPGPRHAAQVARFLRDAKRQGLCDPDQECLRLRSQRPTDIINYSRIQDTPVGLAALLALLAVAIFAHVLVTSIRRRRRDIAVLKTLGFVRTQVSLAVAWQATTLIVIALAVGLPSGIIGGQIAWTSFAASLGATANPQVPVLAVLLAVPIAVVLANAVAAVPGFAAGRLRPAPVLRTE